VTTVIPSSARRLARRVPEIDAHLAVDLAMLLGYVVVRTTDARLPLAAWLLVATVLAIRWPASGLGIAIATAVFPNVARSGVTPDVSLIAAAALGFTLDFVVRRRTPEPIPRSAGVVVAGVAALIVATFLALIRTLRRFDATAATEATLQWTRFVSGLAVLLLAGRAAALGSRRPILLGFVGVAVALAIALIDALLPDLLRTSVIGWMLSDAGSSRATGPFGGPNRLGTVAAVAAVVGFAWFLASGRQRAWSGVLVGLGGAMLALSFSRGALLGFGLGMVAIVLVARRRRRRRYVATLALIGVVVVPLLVAVRLLVSGGTLEALLTNDVGRFDAWLAGLRMIVDQPLTGHGFGSFPVIGTAYGAIDGLESAHNEVIDLWSQAGILAPLAWVVLIVGLIYGAVQRRREVLGLAALGAVVVFAVASSFNVQSTFLSVTGPAWLVAAFAMAPVRHEDSDGSGDTSRAP
jgi:O-antigen ligase